MIKQLRPIITKKSYSQPIAQDMLQALWDAIFKPVFDILGVKRPERVNSMADLKNAFRSGRVFWQEGYVYGKFNSKVGLALRNLGASFNSVKKAYKLDINSIPMDLRTDIVIGKGMNRDNTERILKALEEARQMKIVVGTGMKATTMFDDLNKQAITTLKVLPENIQITVDLTDAQKKDLLNNYQNNLLGYLGDWKIEQIERLKLKTEKNAALGYRADRLADIVKSEFSVSKQRAKFIARQETALFVSKYREERYTGAGVTKYVWSTSQDERVRPDHAALNHQVFSWDSPPVVDRATVPIRRGNPGEDWNCRCVALPVVNLREL